MLKLYNIFFKKIRRQQPKTLVFKPRREFIFILGLFLLWRLVLIIVLLISLNFVPQGSKDRFLGGGPANYQLAPSLFSWANFDGEHYLSIAIFGYRQLEQAFFPVYPMFISFLATPFSYDFFSSLMFSTLIGLVISNTALLIALVLLFELVSLDFSKKIAYFTLIFLLVFPTSFYLGAVYSEAIFLLLAVAVFYAARKQKWWLAGILGGLASATRVFGILLLPALIIEAWQQKMPKRQFVWLLLISAGLLGYMGYQWVSVGDPIAFYRLQELVGEQHQSGIILYPQVMFRYIKMLLTVDILNPIYQTVFLEFVTGIIFMFLPIYGYFKKIRLSYIFFAFVGFLTPTIQGSFSSLPRYILVFFPSFMAMAILSNSWPKWLRLTVTLFFLCWLSIETALFLRGYWVS